MKFFIDTANLAQIREAAVLGILDGVTTNPSLMAKEGIKGTKAINEHYKTICEIVDGDISAEVLSTDFDTILEEGKALAALHPNIVVKVPMIKDGVKAIKWFSDNGIKTNCTLVFSAGQAILAAKAGATYVSPFIGRIDDSGWDGVQLIEQIVRIYAVQGYRTQVLAASIRSANHIIQCAEAGAHVCTCPLEPILGLLKHPLTDLGLSKFIEDSKKMQVVVENDKKRKTQDDSNRPAIRSATVERRCFTGTARHCAHGALLPVGPPGWLIRLYRCRDFVVLQPNEN
jgi:transaldolase